MHNGLQNVYFFKFIADRTPALAQHRSLSPFSEIRSNSHAVSCGVVLQADGVYLLKGSLLNGSPSLNACSAVARKLEHIPTEAESKALFDQLVLSQC